MLISISGTQGSGKTTILNEIKRLGYNVIERKTSRSILADWAVTLDQVYNDRELSIKFQNELLARKMADELDAISSEQLWFTERSYADVFAYALITNGWANGASDWLDQYYLECKSANKMYGTVFFVKPFQLDQNQEADGVRGINKHYGRLVDTTIYNTLQRMSYDEAHFRSNFELKEIESPHIEERVRLILRVSHDLWLDKAITKPEVSGATSN